MKSNPAARGSGLLACAALLLSLLAAPPVRAQGDASPPTTQSIIDALKPALEPPPGRTRGLSLDLPASAESKPKARHRPQEPMQARHVDLAVPFEFNADRLTDQGRELLDKLAQALASRELAGVASVTLEGHTDGVGSAAYNRALSLRRAQSVRLYLQAVPELHGKRLRVVGKGASELLNPADPADAANRRVRVLVYYAGSGQK